MRALGFTTSWQGVDQLDRRIDVLLDVATSTEIINAMLPGAQHIADLWRSKVPYETGRYHDSIRVELGEDDEFGIPGIDIFTDAVSDIGFNYPEALEFGTSRMPAHPSALPAFDEGAPAAIEMAVERLDALILAALAR